MAFYAECMRNFAASLGGRSVDGCQQYVCIPGTDNCDACGCHRSFHRRISLPNEVVVSSVTTAGSSGHDTGASPGTAAAGGARAGTGPGNLINMGPLVLDQQAKPSRMRFSEEQKQRMGQAAARLGWLMPKTPIEEEELAQFCQEVGVTRQNFKTWMNNQRNRH